MSELSQFIIVVALGGLCFGCGYLVDGARSARMRRCGKEGDDSPDYRTALPHR